MTFEFSHVAFTPIVVFNLILFAFFSLAFFYQIIYLIIGVIKNEVVLPKAKKEHRFAFMIAAHNEEVVITELIRSIQEQKYPQEFVDIYVVADACTDKTAEVAREAGAFVYERNDLARKGKSWALNMGFNTVLNERGEDYYDAFVIFDADNLLSKNYLLEMNKVLDMGYLVSTSYRNSKNFDSSWISSAYALWFLREARFLNNARMIAHTSCAISGSGWMIANSLVKAMHGWDFHTLTEDIQLSTFCAAKGIQIAYSPGEFFDEQPVTFKASWVQRLRWTKGFYEVFFTYGKDLIKGIAKRRFASYDMLMTIAPAMILTLISTLVNLTYLTLGSLSHGFFATSAEIGMCVGSLVVTYVSMYITFAILAAITTVFERKRIYSQKRWRIVSNIFTFPLFMMTYIPITVVALFKKVEWVPTKHEFAMSVDQVTKQ